MERSPFRRMELHYEHSYLSEIFAGLNLSKNRLTDLLRIIGKDRGKIVSFMKQFVSGNGHILFDATNIVSKSEKMNINLSGYNSKNEYDPQINLLYAFSRDDKTPVYYRVIPGNIREVTALKLSVEESGVRDMVVVADKGFGSQTNLEMMDEAGLQYIIPLKRNSQWFDKSVLEQGDKGKFDGYFLWQKRIIWHYSKTLKNGKRIFVFLDEELRNAEQKSYINNIERKLEGYTQQTFLEKQYVFGTIVIITNTEKTAEDIYSSYKQRGEIEQSFDFLKNLLEQDKSYMQNEKSLEAWAFINHIALLLNYKLYNSLRDSKKIKKYSIDELLSHLKYISKAKINDEWLTTEITRKTSDLLTDLNIHIT
jgi:transposase